MDIDPDDAADADDEVRSIGSDGYRSAMGEDDDNQNEFESKGGRDQIRLKDIDPNRDLQPYITLMNPKVTRKHPRLILPPGVVSTKRSERKYDRKGEEEDEDRTRTPSPATSPSRTAGDNTERLIGNPKSAAQAQETPAPASSSAPAQSASPSPAAAPSPSPSTFEAPAPVSVIIPARAPIPERMPQAERRQLPAALQSQPPLDAGSADNAGSAATELKKPSEGMQPPIKSINPVDVATVWRETAKPEDIKIARYMATVPKNPTVDEVSDRKDLEIALGTSPKLLVNSWLHHKHTGIIDERALTLPPEERLKGTHATTGRKLELAWAGSVEGTVALLTTHQNVDLRRASEWNASAEQLSRLSALHAAQASIMLDALAAKRRLPSSPGGEEANRAEYAAARVLMARAGRLRDGDIVVGSSDHNSFAGRVAQLDPQTGSDSSSSKKIEQSTIEKPHRQQPKQERRDEAPLVLVQGQVVNPLSAGVVTPPTVTDAKLTETSPVASHMVSITVVSPPATSLASGPIKPPQATTPAPVIVKAQVTTPSAEPPKSSSGPQPLAQSTTARPSAVSAPTVAPPAPVSEPPLGPRQATAPIAIEKRVRTPSQPEIVRRSVSHRPRTTDRLAMLASSMVPSTKNRKPAPSRHVEPRYQSPVLKVSKGKSSSKPESKLPSSRAPSTKLPPSKEIDVIRSQAVASQMHAGDDEDGSSHDDAPSGDDSAGSQTGPSDENDEEDEEENEGDEMLEEGEEGEGEGEGEGADEGEDESENEDEEEEAPSEDGDLRPLPLRIQSDPRQWPQIDETKRMPQLVEEPRPISEPSRPVSDLTAAHQLRPSSSTPQHPPSFATNPPHPPSFATNPPHPPSFATTSPHPPSFATNPHSQTFAKNPQRPVVPSHPQPSHRIGLGSLPPPTSAPFSSRAAPRLPGHANGPVPPRIAVPSPVPLVRSPDVHTELRFQKQDELLARQGNAIMSIGTQLQRVTESLAVAQRDSLAHRREQDERERRRAEDERIRREAEERRHREMLALMKNGSSSAGSEQKTTPGDVDWTPTKPGKSTVSESKMSSSSASLASSSAPSSASSSSPGSDEDRAHAILEGIVRTMLEGADRYEQNPEAEYEAHAAKAIQKRLLEMQRTGFSSTPSSGSQIPAYLLADLKAAQINEVMHHKREALLCQKEYAQNRSEFVDSQKSQALLVGDIVQAISNLAKPYLKGVGFSNLPGALEQVFNSPQVIRQLQRQYAMQDTGYVQDPKKYVRDQCLLAVLKDILNKPQQDVIAAGVAVGEAAARSHFAPPPPRRRAPAPRPQGQQPERRLSHAEVRALKREQDEQKKSSSPHVEPKMNTDAKKVADQDPLQVQEPKAAAKLGDDDLSRDFAQLTSATAAAGASLPLAEPAETEDAPNLGELVLTEAERNMAPTTEPSPEMRQMLGSIKGIARHVQSSVSAPRPNSEVMRMDAELKEQEDALRAQLNAL